MEGREPMGLGGPPGSFSSILQRGVGSPPVQQPPPLHAPAALRPSAISIASNPSNPSNANPNPVSVSADSSIAAAAAAGASALPSHMGMPMIRAEPLKRKRGRPRKYGPDGSMALALAPMSSSSTPGAFSPLQKRGRGRPPGSGRRQQLAALGEWLSGSAGVGFAPHVITIAAGEDVATKIMSFSQQGPRAVCILSANGAISNATLRQPATSGGTVTYEGRFEILSLSGSFLLTENGGTRSRTGGLSISLAGPDGRVIGGGVAGMLMAASPVQVIVGSFISNGRKNQPKQSNPEVPVSRPSTGVFPAGPSGAMPISRAPPNDNSGNKSSGPGSPPPTQNPGMQLSVPPQQLQNMPPYASMGWQSSHSTNDLRRNTDINIPLPGG